MSRFLILVGLAVGCHHSDPPLPPVDGERAFVASVRDDLDAHARIFDAANKEAREICARRRDIAECSDVLARLPPRIHVP